MGTLGGCPIGSIIVGMMAYLTCIASAQLLGSGYVSPSEESRCYVPCRDTPDTNVPVPETDCKMFYVCREGRSTNRLVCSGNRKFDVNIGACNHAGLVNCVDPSCPPTDFPTLTPSRHPSRSPSFSPTESPSDSPTESPSESPTYSPSAAPTPLARYARDLIINKRSIIEERVFKSYNAAGTPYPSIRYTFQGFFRGLEKMAIEGFGADFKFMLWDTLEEKYRYGLVNLAAFLANAMVEAIYDDTCDELNWQQVAGRYAISNSCGQEGRNYQEETCGIYSCIPDHTLEITAVQAANDVRAPPPMECRPGSTFSGYWDTNTGTEIKYTPYANTAGRIDVSGCCYWGRGVLLTRGSCNIGKLNYYLGARANREGRNSMYPDIDFCVDPEATCASSATEELRWTTAFFEWSERVQRYDDNGWNYENELYKFFDQGMADDSFIDSVGRILFRGCHEVGCSDDVRMADDRKANFNVIINDVFAIGGIKITTKHPTAMPTPAPTPQPLEISFPTPKPMQQYFTPQPTFRPFTPQPTLRPFNPLPNLPTSPLTTLRPTPQPQGTFPGNICLGQASKYIALNECKEFVQCIGGQVVLQQSCSSGLLFDSSINACNWATLVSVCSAPTQRPTARYTQQLPYHTTPLRPPELHSSHSPIVRPITLPTAAQEPLPIPQTPRPTYANNMPNWMEVAPGSQPSNTRPTFVTPMPNWMEVKPEPFNSDTNGQNKKPDKPFDSEEMIIPLEGNGANDRTSVWSCGCSIFGIATYQLLLAVVS